MKHLPQANPLPKSPSQKTDFATTRDPDIMDNTLSRALIEAWQSNFEATSLGVEVTQRQEDHKGPTSLLDETVFLHLVVVKEGEPSYVPLSTNLGLKFKRRMLYFSMDFEELTLDGLIDTGVPHGHPDTVTNSCRKRLQPIDVLNEEGDVTFCAAIVTLHEGTMRIHVNNFTDQPYKLNKPGPAQVGAISKAQK